MSSGTSHPRRLTQNSVGLRWPRFQKTGLRKYRPNIDIHTSLAVVTFIFFPLLSLPFLNLHLADPKVDDFPFSIQSAILCADMLCFRSIMLVRSFTVNKIRGTRHQPHLQAIHNLIVFVAYCHLLELYVKCAALYRIFIAHSFWNTRYGRPRGRKFRLRRSL